MAKRRKPAGTLPLGDDVTQQVLMGFQPGLVDRYAIPPFSVLDARQGYWQARKSLWIRLGIRSELGRGDDGNSTPAAVGAGGLSETLAPRKGKDRFEKTTGKYVEDGGGVTYHSTHTADPNTYHKKRKAGKADARSFGLDMMRGEGADRYGYVGKAPAKANDRVIPTGTGPAVFSDGAVNPYLARSRAADDDEDVAVMGTSIFDPVLTELLYCWFSPPGGQVLDPFAGGSVRGIVAAALGRDYTGIDLRPEQVAANEAQWERIGPNLPGEARWLTGDARDVLQLVFDPDRQGLYDFILTCPPYFDLEQYSYDPADLSNAGSYNDFLRSFRDVIERSCSLLADDRFAAVVVGDVRDGNGFYRNFPAHTISLFQKHGGLTLYNEAILVTAVGSLPVRIGKQFDAGRKLGKTHQNVLVFYKGNPKRIRDVLGDIEMGHSGGG